MFESTQLGKAVAVTASLLGIAILASVALPQDGSAGSEPFLTDVRLFLPQVAGDSNAPPLLLQYDGRRGSCTALDSVDLMGFDNGIDVNGNPVPTFYMDDGGPGVHGIVNNNWDGATMVDGFIEAWNFDPQDDLQSYARVAVVPGVIPPGRQGVFDLNVPANFPLNEDTRFSFCTGLVELDDAPGGGFDADYAAQLLEEAGWTDLDYELDGCEDCLSTEVFAYQPGPGGPQGIFGGMLPNAGGDLGPNFMGSMALPGDIQTPPLLLFDTTVDRGPDTWTIEPVDVVPYPGGSELVFRSFSPDPIRNPTIDIELVSLNLTGTFPIDIPHDLRANAWFHFSVLLPGTDPADVELVEVPFFDGTTVNSFPPSSRLQPSPPTAVVFDDGFGVVISDLFNWNNVLVDIDGVSMSYPLIIEDGLDGHPEMVGRANTNGVGTIPPGGSSRVSAQFAGPGVTDEANIWSNDLDIDGDGDLSQEELQSWVLANRSRSDIPDGPGDQIIFADGFESGDTSAWSSTVP